MEEEPAKQTTVEIVESQPIDERLIKTFEKIAEKTYLMIQKRDFRATMVHKQEKAELPDSEAALIHIDEESRDELDNPRELDFKGHITPWEAFMFKDVNYAMALANLKDWAFFEEPELDAMGNPKFDENGNIKIIRIPVNLAQIDMLSKKRLNLGIDGRQAWKHIAERRANAGMQQEETMAGKVYGWAGFRKERVSPEQLESQYGSSAKK